MTLLTNEWKPEMSNTILEYTFIKSKAPMKPIYEELIQTGRLGDNRDHIVKAKVKYNMNEPQAPVYFLYLR